MEEVPPTIVCVVGQSPETPKKEAARGAAWLVSGTEKENKLWRSGAANCSFGNGFFKCCRGEVPLIICMFSQ